MNFATPAGIVGIVSRAEARTSALLGVFTSVATIATGADIGVSHAFASWDEARGSLQQLLLNVGILIVVGTATLRCRRVIRRRESKRRDARGTPDTAGLTGSHAGAVSRNSRIAKATNTITAVQITTIMVG